MNPTSREVPLPSSPDEEVVYVSSIRGLFYVALKSRMTPALVRRLRAAGLDLEKPPPAQLTRAVWNGLLGLTVEELWPELPRDEGFRQLGMQQVLGFTETLAGKAQAAMARLLGPRRILDQLRNSLNSGCNYNQTRVEPIEDRHVRFWINETGVQNPGFFGGIMEAALQMAGASNVAIHLLEVGPRGALYDVRWD